MVKTVWIRFRAGMSMKIRIAFRYAAKCPMLFLYLIICANAWCSDAFHVIFPSVHFSTIQCTLLWPQRKRAILAASNYDLFSSRCSLIKPKF